MKTIKDYLFVVWVSLWVLTVVAMASIMVGLTIPIEKAIN